MTALYEGWTPTKAEANLPLLWSFITGAAALPSGLTTADLASYLRNTEIVNVLNFGAKGGALDPGETEAARALTNTDAFIAAFAKVAAAGGGEVRVPDGTYVVQLPTTGPETQCVKPCSNSTLTLAPGAVLKAPDSSIPNSMVVNVYGVTNVTIQGGTIDGNRAGHTGGGEGAHCICIGGAQRIRVNNTIIKNAHGDGVYVDSDLYGNGHGISEDISFVKCIVDNCYRNGMSFSGCRWFFVLGSSIRTTSGTAPMCGILVEQSSGPGDVTDGVIVGNFIGSNGSGPSGYGVALSNAGGGFADPYRVIVAINIFSANNIGGVNASPGALLQGCVTGPNITQTGDIQSLQRAMQIITAAGEHALKILGPDMPGRGMLSIEANQASENPRVTFHDDSDFLYGLSASPIAILHDAQMNQPHQFGGTGGIKIGTTLPSTITSGSGAPNNANGANGDYYLRSDTPGSANQRLYVKAAGSWVGIV